MPAPRVGINLPWLHGAYGHDLGHNAARPDWPIAYNVRDVEMLLDLLHAFGIRLVRFWLFEQGEGLIADDQGQVVAIDERFLHNLSDLCQRFKDRDMLVYWALLDANSVFRNEDHITRIVMMDPRGAESFDRFALSAVLPIIRETAWAIDICNEPEATIRGPQGNGTHLGTDWGTVALALEILITRVKQRCPDIKTSIGSGFSEHHTLRDVPAYRRLAGNLNFLDYHTYLAGGRLRHRGSCLAAWCVDRPLVLGEVGSIVATSERGSIEAWRKAQDALAVKLHRLVDMEYDSAFLWHQPDLDIRDATALIYNGEPGLALHTLLELGQQNSIIL